MISNCKFQISNSNRGFTLVEVLIAIAILVVIFSLGLFISWDFYRGFTFLSEQKIILSVLQKARNQAMSNINEKPHGVAFETGCYIIFEDSYNSAGCNSGTNEVVKTSPTITTSGINQVLFSQLSGNTVTTPAGTNLTITSNGRSVNISITENGKIDIQ